MKKSFRKLLGFAGMISILVLNIGCDQMNSLPSDDKIDDFSKDNAKITGKVLFQDGVTDNSNISVALLKVDTRSASIDDIPAIKTKTNRDGVYSFENLSAGSYTVLATYDDMAIFRSVSIKEGEIFTVENMNLVLKGSLSGKVVINGDVSPVYAEVYIPGTQYKSSCDDDGNFEITGVPVGKNKLWVKIFNNIYPFDFDFEFTAEGNKLKDALTIDYLYNYSSIDNEFNVSARATDRGICFTTRILSNISTSDAYITFYIKENNSGIEMVRDWSKISNSWSTCETYYPLVEKGKKYSFTVSAVQSDYTLYRKNFYIEAIGGLGELKIENADDYTVEINEDCVMYNTKEAEFTDNKNVNILRKGIYYELYEENGTLWNWLWGQTSWFDTTTGTVTLKDESDGVSKWRSFSEFDAILSGHNYIATSRTYITIAGYQDNGQSYFKMNDYKNTIKPWGGKTNKIYVVFYDESGDIKNLPGEKMTFTYDNTSEEFYTLICDYYDIMYEPTLVPYYEGAVESKFYGWQIVNDNHSYTPTFPFTLTASDISEENITVNGEQVKYVLQMKPSIEAKYKAIIMDGDTKLDEVIYLAGSLPAVPTKEGFGFAGYYEDKELTKPVKAAYGNITLYTKWKEGGFYYEGLWNSSSSYQFNVKEGTTYKIKWADFFEGNDVYTSLNKADVSVTCSTANETYFSRVDSGYKDPQTFTASETGECTLSFHNYNNIGDIYIWITSVD